MLIAGPCVIEDYYHLRGVAEIIGDIADDMGIDWVLKASYDKANRTKIDSFRGPGFEDGMEMLARVRKDLGWRVTSDVHSEDEATHAGRYLDIIQIPAFLCRQTDILVAAAQTGRPVNVKKGQFVKPDDIPHIVRKLTDSGCRNTLVTERGSQFGYGDLVVDFRRFGVSNSWVDVLDVTHSVTHWEDSFSLAKCGVSLGLSIFAEVGSTKCDEKRSIPIDRFREFCRCLV
jgi:2-dehydro-3-deoxyphosphooctonate aldolase (KDO 8-P synthase)